MRFSDMKAEKPEKKYRYKHQNIPGFLPYRFCLCALKTEKVCVIIVKNRTWSGEK